jgi:hypothetical protein
VIAYGDEELFDHQVTAWTVGQLRAALQAVPANRVDRLVSVLVSIHLGPAPFTWGHADRVCAVRGRWRTPVNGGQHCWKACWGQPLKSSNLLSSAMPDLRKCGLGHVSTDKIQIA